MVSGNCLVGVMNPVMILLTEGYEVLLPANRSVNAGQLTMTPLTREVLCDVKAGFVKWT